MKHAPSLPTVTTTSPEAIETSSFNAFPAGRPPLTSSDAPLDMSGHPSRASSTYGVRIRPGTPNTYATHASSQPISPRKSSFVGTVHDPDSFIPPLSTASKFSLAWNKLSTFVISSTFLILVVIWASVHRLWVVIPQWARGSKRPNIYAWDENAPHWKKEKIVKDIGYYARQCGYDIRDEDVETQDGYFLR